MLIISDRDEMDDSTLRKFLELVHLHAGITMTHAKKTLLQGRIRPRIKKLGLESYSSYLDLMKTDKNEIQEFINLVTTHETSFFRTQRVWDYFNNDFLPKWIDDNPDKVLRIWSAASSTGEEVYTIGICCEEFRSQNAKFNYQILGTDISTTVIAQAIQGEYAGRSIENFKMNNKLLFEKYMNVKEDKYCVTNSVKSKIRFAPHNLYHRLPAPNDFDIVFLRNVLIYFEKSDQEKVVANIDKALSAPGVLVIGESESLNGLSTSLDFVSPLIYKKSGITSDQ